MTPTARFSLAAGVVVAAIAGLIVWSLRSSTAYYVTPTELAEDGGRAEARSVRVAGRVVEGSIRQNGATTTFDLTDGASALTITTRDVLPDTFAADIETVAEGGLIEPGVFSASTVLVKCPSKFEAELAAGTS